MTKMKDIIMSNIQDLIKKYSNSLFILIVTLSLVACSTYGDKVAPIPLPSEQAGSVNIDGVELYAEAYIDKSAAEKAFGFDIRGAGLLPVRFVIDNQSTTDANITREQTFLIDKQNQAWPLLTYDQAFKRVNESVELGEIAKGSVKPGVLAAATGALIGAAIGVVSGGSVGDAAGAGAAAGTATGAVVGGARRYQHYGKEIRQNLASKSFDNGLVYTGEIAYGFLFFPGDDEIDSVSGIRLSLNVGD
ncbi:MAG: hypothetical protein AAF372_03205, partial [Pseudomonadota bacterium]